MLPSREMAEIAVKALDGKKGKEIKLIRIDKITTLAEYFVICTGTSNTQIKRPVRRSGKAAHGGGRRAAAPRGLPRRHVGAARLWLHRCPRVQ